MREDREWARERRRGERISGVGETEKKKKGDAQYEKRQTVGEREDEEEGIREREREMVRERGIWPAQDFERRKERNGFLFSL